MVIHEISNSNSKTWKDDIIGGQWVRVKKSQQSAVICHRLGGTGGHETQSVRSERETEKV